VDCNGESFICRAVCLIGTADLTGKCALQGFTQYNGMCGCSFCETEGQRVPVMKGNCQVYPYSAGPPKNIRTKNKTVKDGKVAQQKAEPVSSYQLNSAAPIYMNITIFTSSAPTQLNTTPIKYSSEKRRNQ